MTRLLFAGVVAAGLIPGPAAAHWPLRTEEATTAAAGSGELVVALTRVEITEPYRLYGVRLTPDQGVLWHLPEVEATLGLGPRAEVTLQYSYLRFDPEEGKGAGFESGDVRFWTKLGLWRSQRGALAARVGAKLPSGSNSRGVSTDETDVFLTALADLALGPVQLGANLGMAILGDPTKNQAQDDLVTWAVSARLPLPGGIAVGAEVGAASGPFGVQRRRSFREQALALDYTAGAWRLGAAWRRGSGDFEKTELSIGCALTF